MTNVPNSVAQAARLAERYAELDSNLAAVEEHRTVAIANANAVADGAAAPLLREIADIKAALEPWWGDVAAVVAQGRKSAELGGCLVGTRSSRPKLTHPFSTDDEAIERLQETRLFKQTTRVKFSLDRTATAKILSLGGKNGECLTSIGFRIEQDEKFFIERTKQAATIAP